MSLLPASDPRQASLPGVPLSTTGFHPSVQGAVVVGIGVALVVEVARSTEWSGTRWNAIRAHRI